MAGLNRHHGERGDGDSGGGVAKGKSEKPRVFSVLFERRFDMGTGKFTPQTVTNGELQEVLNILREEEGLSLSSANPANFLKDFLRSDSRNEQWPDEIAAAGYTARQSYSEGRVFDFVPYKPGQAVPFPDDFSLAEDAVIHRVETVSLPSAARALGRGDEAWLIQVCVHQRILQTHFALYSELKVLDLFHLQNSLKGTPEIDSVFLLVLLLDGTSKKALITLEAKRGDPVLPDQIRNQVAYMAKQTKSRPGLEDIELIVPVAVSTLTRNAERIIALFEMTPVTVTDGASAYDAKTIHDIPLPISRVVGYTLSPPVVGI